MAYSELENSLLNESRKIPPDFLRMKQLIDDGADINAADYDETLLSELMLGYPNEEELPNECNGCNTEIKGSDCDDCSICNPQNLEGRFLPELVRFFLDNGYDVTRDNGAHGGKALKNLSWSSYDEYIIDAAKLLLHAGADPEYKEEDDTVVEWMEVKESAAACVDKDHSLENLFYTMVEIMLAYIEHREYDGIQYYAHAIGKQIMDVNLYFDAEVRPSGLFEQTSDSGTIYTNCYHGSLVFDCEGLSLSIPDCTNIIIDPSAANDSVQKQSLTNSFNECIGAKIADIDFEHHDVERGATSYSQAVILIKLDNGHTIEITNNFGEVPDKESNTYFKILGGS